MTDSPTFDPTDVSVLYRELDPLALDSYDEADSYSSDSDASHNDHNGSQNHNHGNDHNNNSADHGNDHNMDHANGDSSIPDTPRRRHRRSTAHTYEEEQRMQAMAAKLNALNLRGSQTFHKDAAQPAMHSYNPGSYATPISGARTPHDIAAATSSPTKSVDEDPEVKKELGAMFERVEECLLMRHKYMKLSNQREIDNPKNKSSWSIYPPPPRPSYKDTTKEFADVPSSPLEPSVGSLGAATTTTTANLLGTDPADRPTPILNGAGFELANVKVPHADPHIFVLDDSCVFQVYDTVESFKNGSPITHVPTIKEYYMDVDRITAIASDGPSKSFAFRRLQYLEAKFNMYSLINDYHETTETKKNPHRDFYNVRKVDTHVHHSASMNQKHLLRFIKSKMKKSPNEVVIFRDDQLLTLAEVFQSLGLKAYDLSIDTMDMHAHKDTFHRFDKFNLKYNPIGESRLREIFLKTDNYINGRYLAELTREVVSDLESSKYQMAEYRISIYGKDPHEWDKLAAWVVDNKLFSNNVRWLIQIPRLYDVYKAGGIVKNFQDVVINIFKPLFEVTKDPRLNPKLHAFLQRVVGFDSVDDESKVDRRFHRKYPTPFFWDAPQNPPYSYYLYYLYANIASLNAWRRARGFNCFNLRPHAGEAGDPEHLIAAFLTSYGISHGILLRKLPFVQYLFYLDQIGIAMSPLSNNALFLSYAKNPFYTYFKCGLNVSLSSDDPLQFSFTREPLIEEYSVAAQIYKLSPVDMCELARNSVLQSGWEAAIKQHWIGHHYWLRGPDGNVVEKTNVPNVRMSYRMETLLHELKLIKHYTGKESHLCKDPESDRCPA